MRLEHGIGPLVHRPAETVQARTALLPHALVEREGVQEDDGHSAATSTCSAATEGRRQARSTQSASAGHGSSGIPSRSRARSSQEGTRSARPKARPLSHGVPPSRPSRKPSSSSKRARAPARPGEARSTASRNRRSGRRAAGRRRARRGRPARGRLGIALVQELVDHGRLGQDPPVLVEHRDFADRVHLVQPGRPVGEVDLDGFVRDPLLGQDDPHAGAVRTASGVVEGDHGPASPRSAPSSPIAAAIDSSSSCAGGSSAGDAAVRAAARTAAGSAPVSRATTRGSPPARSRPRRPAARSTRGRRGTRRRLGRPRGGRSGRPARVRRRSRHDGAHPLQTAPSPAAEATPVAVARLVVDGDPAVPRRCHLAAARASGSRGTTASRPARRS